MSAKRVEGLLVQRVEGELLIIREATEEAHALNETAAIVFDLCDGKTSLAQMTAEVSRRSGLPSDQVVVEFALAELEDAGLIVREAAAAASEPTRRSLIRKLALSAAAVGLLPVVDTVLVTPASARRRCPPPNPLRPEGRPPGCEVPPSPTPTPTPEETVTPSPTPTPVETVTPIGFPN